jgi:hypothetical protein
MLSELQSIARIVTPYALDIYDRSAVNALLPQLTQVVPNPTRAKSVTMEWTSIFANLRKWVGERVVEKSFAERVTIVGEKYEMTDSFDRYDIERGTALANVEQKSAALAEGFAAGKAMIAVRVLRENRLTYDGQNFFDTDHVHPDGRSYSNVVDVTRSVAAAPDVLEARAELTAALLQLMSIRLWGDSIASAENVRQNLIVITKSNAVFSAYELLRTEPSFGADPNTWKGTFSLWLDYNPAAGTENKVDVVMALPSGPRPVLWMPTREPSGIEFDTTQAFKIGQIFMGMDGEFGVEAGFPQCAVRIDPD